MSDTQTIPGEDRRQEEYPYNLIRAVAEKKNLQFPAVLTRDICAGIQYALTTLEEQEQEILRKRYAERISRTAIGSRLAMSAEDVKQLEVKALQKLCQPIRWNYIQYGVEGYLQTKAAIEYRRGYSKGYYAGYRDGAVNLENGLVGTSEMDDVLNIPLGRLGLSARANNCLCAIGCTCVREIAVLREEEIWKIRRMGRKTADEVARKLQALGVRPSAWDLFLL